MSPRVRLDLDALARSLRVDPAFWAAVLARHHANTHTKETRT